MIVCNKSNDDLDVDKRMIKYVKYVEIVNKLFVFYQFKTIYISHF